jgi:hypothetical protein
VYRGIGSTEALVDSSMPIEDFAFVSVLYPDMGMWLHMAVAVGDADTPPTSLSVCVEEKTAVTIDKTFLPQDLYVGPDWEESNKNSPQYIKNKTHYFIPGSMGT